MSFLNLMRSDLQNLPEYLLDEEEMRYRLHANELPWCPLESALNTYPLPDPAKALQEKLAKQYGVKVEQMLLTRGSDEGIDLLMRLFMNPGVDSILQCSPTFSMYAFFAKLQGASVIDVPLDVDNDFEWDEKAILKALKPGCKLLMLCCPNNPTGNGLSYVRIKSLCELLKDRVMVVVDEAYIEFSDEESATSLIDAFDNLIVLRTLSKAYGLAGLRLGVVMSQSSLIEQLRRMVPPYSFSNVVISKALEALSRDEWFKASRQKIVEERTRLREALLKSNIVEKVYPSVANFLLVKTKEASRIFDALKARQIAIRRFENSSLNSYLRITVGSRLQNDLVLSEFLS